MQPTKSQVINFIKKNMFEPPSTSDDQKLNSWIDGNGVHHLEYKCAQFGLRIAFGAFWAVNNFRSENHLCAFVIHIRDIHGVWTGKDPAGIMFWQV